MTFAALAAVCSRSMIRRAMAQGRIRRLQHGWYRLPPVAGAGDDRLPVPAAAAWRLGQWRRTADIRIAVDIEARRLPPAGVTFVRRRLSAVERRDGRIGLERTVIDSVTSLDFVDALAVADSALREYGPLMETLHETVTRVQGPSGVTARAVIALASPLAANPFEYHGHLTEFVRDEERYNELTSCGWRVLRVTWLQMVNEPDKVYQLMRRMVQDAG